jgi:hypothetical protein
MNDYEVLKVIEKYLEKSSYFYAVLIDGEWGSGKTYFVKKTLMPYISELDCTIINEKSLKFEPIYISLYGVSSIEEISRQICVKMFAKTENSTIKKIIQSKTINKMSKNKTVRKISNFGVKLISDYIKSNNITVSGINEAMMGLMDIERFVMIFDDLERCGLGVNEVLGYINNFVEHDGIKTIIIANQKEMGKLNVSNNLELKYLIASNKDINLEKKLNSDVLNIDELKERTETIFNQNFLYQQIKEKLIGITINYKADIESILENLTNEIIQNKVIHKVVIENKDFLTTTANRLQHENLRTIQFALERFSELGEIVCKQPCGEFKEQILQEIFKYTIYSSIRFKKDNYINKWQGLSDVDYISDDVDRRFSTIKGFRFVDIAVSQSIIDKDYIADFINKYVKQFEGKYNPIEKLQAYWEMEDEEIIECLKEIEEKLINNNISYNFYSRLIKKIIELVYVGFDVEFLNRSLENMKSNISKVSYWFNIEEFGGIPTDEKIIAKYKETIKPLIDILEQKKEQLIEKKLNSYFDDGENEDWGSDFYIYCWTYSNDFDRNNAFFSLMRIDKVIKCLKLSNSKNMSYFFRAIDEVNNYNDDYYNVIKLRDELSEEAINFVGIIKKYNLNLITESLNKKIEALNPTK